LVVINSYQTKVPLNVDIVLPALERGRQSSIARLAGVGNGLRIAVGSAVAVRHRGSRITVALGSTMLKAACCSLFGPFW